MAWPSYITVLVLLTTRTGRATTVTRPPIKSKFVSSRGPDSLARIIGWGRVAGFGGHRGRDEISRDTIKAWIIYCGMSRVCVGLALLVDTGGKSKSGVIFSNKLGVVCLRILIFEIPQVRMVLCGIRFGDLWKICGKMGSSGWQTSWIYLCLRNWCW